jgi:hypothetical protein
LEQLAEQMSPDALEVVLEELPELDHLVDGEVLPPLEQAPTRLRQDRLVAVPLHLGTLVATHLVHAGLRTLPEAEGSSTSVAIAQSRSGGTATASGSGPASRFADEKWTCCEPSTTFTRTAVAPE